MRKIKYRYIALFSAAGLILPLGFRGLRALLHSAGAERVANWILNLQFLLCPPTVFSGPWQEANLNEGFETVAIGVNIAGYTLLGVLIVLGLRKYRWLLYVAGTLVICLWIRLASLL